MEYRRIKWEEDKESTSEKVRTMSLNNYNNRITSVRWSNKYPKYSQILYLVGVSQKLSNDPKKPP